MSARNVLAQQSWVTLRVETGSIGVRTTALLAITSTWGRLVTCTLRGTIEPSPVGIDHKGVIWKFAFQIKSCHFRHQLQVTLALIYLTVISPLRRTRIRGGCLAKRFRISIGPFSFVRNVLIAPMHASVVNLRTSSTLLPVFEQLIIRVNRLTIAF